MKKNVLILITAFVLFSCKTTLTVLNDVDRSVDFSQYKTIEFYGWTDDNGWCAMNSCRLRSISLSSYTELNAGYNT